MKPAIIKIIQNDYPSILALVAPLATGLLYLDVLYLGLSQQIFSRNSTTDADSGFFLILFLIVLTIGIPFFLFRLYKFRQHFKNGIAVTGKIIYIYFEKDRGKIEFSYIFNAITYRGGNAVHKSKYIKSLEVGQQVDIIVAKNNPKKAYIKDLYI